MRISDWSSDVCSSDLRIPARPAGSRNPLIPRSCRSGGAAPTMQKMTSNRFRWAWWLLAYASLGLGLVGVVVPGLPTVPFVLLSAYAAARGSERMPRWLTGTRVFRPKHVEAGVRDQG